MQETDNKVVEIYTDGGCSGNPGVGAWAFFVPAEEIGQSGNEKLTTNNRMELTAAIEALVWAIGYKDSYTTERKIAVYTDSRYVQKGITAWLQNWKKNNWKTANKHAVKNKDLWQRLDALTTQISVSWHWVEGHAGHEGNEEAHTLVSARMKELM